jgi:3,4-dihydroxy 2-butanone 4-phosphate synthase/GTP cyclohydrolase II
VEYWRTMTRINSTLVNNDILGTLTNDADKKLDNMFHLINKENRGAILFINQEVQSIDLLNRIVELKDLQTVFIRRHRSKWITRILVSEHRYYMISIYQKIRLVTNAEQTKRVGMDTA